MGTMIIDFETNKTIDIDELWAQSDYLEALNVSYENDRAFILVSAVALEQKISILLESLLPSISSLEDNKEFTFSFKTNLLKSFDLYNAKVIEYIHLIRKIRNEFAHDLTISNFEKLHSGTINHIDQCFTNIKPNRESKEIREKIEAIVKWLFWELISLEPYTKKLRAVLTSRETKERLLEIKRSK
jgi:hypothetical protein